jgi:hypothetical protein
VRTHHLLYSLPFFKFVAQAPLQIIILLEEGNANEKKAKKLEQCRRTLYSYFIIEVIHILTFASRCWLLHTAALCAETFLHAVSIKIELKTACEEARHASTSSYRIVSSTHLLLLVHTATPSSELYWLASTSPCSPCNDDASMHRFTCRHTIGVMRHQIWSSWFCTAPPPHNKQQLIS